MDNNLMILRSHRQAASFFSGNLLQWSLIPIQIFLIALLSQGLTSCQDPESPTEEHSHIIIDGSPVTFTLQDDDCAANQSSRDFSAVPLQIFNHKTWQLEQVTFDLNPIMQGDYARLAPVRTYHGLVTDSSNQLFFCRASQPYKRLSIEHAALVALTGIQQTAKTCLATKIITLEQLQPIQLSIHSHNYQKIVDDGPHHLTIRHLDNAFWLSQQGAQQSFIAILPPSEAFFHSDIPLLTDQPAVFSHEYGHHILAQVCPGLVYLPGNTLSNDTNLVLKALNEAAADLIASYSYHENMREFAGLTLSHGSHDRDLFASSFSNRIEKVVSQENIEFFFNDNVQKRWSFHKFGAVLAFIMRRLLDANNLTLRDYFLWLQHLDTSRQMTGNINQVQILRTLLESFLDFLPVTLQGCELAQELIPWLDLEERPICQI